jgi:hypothetical protein
MQYISENELDVVKGLLHYLNQNVDPPTTGVAFEGRIIDSNGESLGDINYEGEPGAGYVLTFPKED